MKFYDSFHGIGGFRYGLEQAGMECVGGCEIDKFACQAYGVINDEDCRSTDIRTVDPIRLLDFDIFVGGFPCQDLSVAGKRKGFDGERSVLFFEILRICEIKRPTYILLENVTGLLSHNIGETFGIVLKSLDELGYDAEWQVHNSLAHVPQNRERIFIVGHLRGRSTRTIFPFGSENEKNAKSERKLKQLNIGFPQSQRVYGINGVSPSLSAAVRENSEGGAVPPNILINNRIRKLTPLECFRLQSFPDWWYYKLKEAGLSDSQLYKMAGNGVTSEVACEIGKRLIGLHEVPSLGRTHLAKR